MKKEKQTGLKSMKINAKNMQNWARARVRIRKI